MCSINNNKKLKNDATTYCINCNKIGHYFRKCNLPLISNGLISFNISNIDNDTVLLLENYICEKLNNGHFNDLLVDKKSKKINYNNLNNLWSP